VSILTQQIGPLPGGAWIAVVGGGLAIGFLGRRNRTAAQAAVPATTAQDQSSQGAVQYVGPGTGVTSMGTPRAATNEEWASQAVGYLIAKGAVASRATNAISHILFPDSANPTSPEDSAIYNMAVAGVGPPPILPSQAFIPDAPGAVGAPTFTSVLTGLFGTANAPTVAAQLRSRVRGALSPDAGGSTDPNAVPVWIDLTTGARVVGRSGISNTNLVQTGWEKATA
jgi:hypothetical protein